MFPRPLLELHDNNNNKAGKAKKQTHVLMAGEAAGEVGQRCQVYNDLVAFDQAATATSTTVARKQRKTATRVLTGMDATGQTGGEVGHGQMHMCNDHD